MTIVAVDLRGMSRTKLDEVFRSSPPGPIPAGRAHGTAVLLPGASFDPVLRALVRAFCWKGKVFRPASSDLKNRIGPLGTPAIRARVYVDESWFDQSRAIILDYSRTSFVARLVRDEIREVAPDLYLGIIYLARWRVGYFVLEFPPGSGGLVAA